MVMRPRLTPPCVWGCSVSSDVIAGVTHPVSDVWLCSRCVLHSLQSPGPGESEAGAGPRSGPGEAGRGRALDA